MKDLKFNKVIKNDIPVYLFKTSNFTTINIKIFFKNEFTKENSTKYSLLTNILTNTSKKYNTKKKVSSVLDNLYAANILVTTSKMYKTRLTSFTLSIVDPNYLDDKINLIKKGIELLSEFLFNPNTINDAFNEKIFLEEKEQLKDYIVKQYDDKDYCAYRGFIEKMCDNENITISSNGNLDDLEAITSNDIYNTYLDMLNNSEKMIAVIGDYDEKNLLKCLNNIIIKLPQQKLDYPIYSKDIVKVNNVKEFEEKREIKQAKLFMGYRANLTIDNPNYYKALVFTKMLGGLYDSTLTQVLREKHSLCYYVYDSYLADNNILYISSGIEKGNYKKTVNLVNKVFNDYQNGKFTNKLLDIVKKDFKESYMTIFDSPLSIINSYITNVIIGVDKDLTFDEIINERIKKINSVTLEDIKEISKEFILDTIYLMSE